MHYSDFPEYLNPKEFKTIYPLYINSNRTQQQGRRIGKEKAVPDPNVNEIEQVLNKIKDARVIVEMNKRHPREIHWEQSHFMGRVRVSVPADSGIKNKHSLLLYVAEEISKIERKKFKVHQIVEQPEQATNVKAQTSNAKSQKKQTGNRKKNSRKK